MRPRGNAPIESSGIVNSGTGKQPGGAALPPEGELSRLRNGGTDHGHRHRGFGGVTAKNRNRNRNRNRDFQRLTETGPEPVRGFTVARYGADGCFQAPHAYPAALCDFM